MRNVSLRLTRVIILIYFKQNVYSSGERRGRENGFVLKLTEIGSSDVVWIIMIQSRYWHSILKPGVLV